MAAPVPPGAPTEEVIVFLNYRTMFEADGLDTANLESWREVLDSFGYQGLTRFGFLRELALATPTEVMRSLCPYTTKAEYGPVLNKRLIRMEKELSELVRVEMLPITGIREFLVSCAKQSAKLTSVFLSPFSETNTRVLLEKTEMAPFVDFVHCYTEREYAMLEALEMLNVRPPHIPSHMNHRWEKPGEAPSKTPTRIVVFDADPIGVKYTQELGLCSIGISFNAFEDGVPDGQAASSEFKEHTKALQDAADGGSNTGVAGDAVLLQAGCVCVLRDFSSLQYEYLAHIQPPAKAMNVA